jgi:hypothetical protein
VVVARARARAPSGGAVTGGASSYCTVHASRQIIQHVVDTSTKAYKGTPREKDFMIFHDGLSAWWEKGSQDLMAKLGFRDRQLRGLGSTNKGTRYEGKLPGDSPEVCRGLDAHGFADFERAVTYNCAVSSAYPVGDERRMSMGTPPAVSKTLIKCWTIAPTSERIVEDISAFPRVLGKIVAAEGCVVKDEFLRSGRRERRADGKGFCKNKPRASQRKATLKAAPLHPDCQEAYDAFVKGAKFNVVESDAESSSEEEEEEEEE